MFQNRLNYRVINLAALLFLLWWQIFVKCVSVFSPFIIGFAFSYAFTPLVRYLERKKIPRTASLLIVIFGIIFIIFGLLAVTLPLLYDQLSLFIKMILEVFDHVSSRVPMNIGSFEIKVTDYLNELLKDIGSITSSTTMDFIGKFLNFSGKFIVGFVAFVYFLIDMDKIRSEVKRILQSSNKRFFQYIECMDNEITHYLQGLEMFMVIQLFEYSFLFLIVGHPNWLILGLLACVTTVIPYFGGLITNLIAILMASVVSFPLMISTTIICLIFPQLDGYLISPKVYGKTNNVNPLITIMAVSVGGTVAGIWGIIVALPCYLLIRTTYNFYKNDLKKSVSIVKKSI